MQFTLVLDVTVDCDANDITNIDLAKDNIRRYFELKNLQSVIINETTIHKFEIRNICASVTLQELAHILER